MSEPLDISDPESHSNPHHTDMVGRFVRHPVAANLLMMVMLLAGVFALLQLNRQFFPNFATDFITVTVIWPGASAEDVARSITTPLEQQLRNLDDVDEMRSTSMRGMSRIVVEYNEGTDMGVALDQVNERVGLVRNLPSDAEKPEISKFVRNEPIASLILTGDATPEALRAMAYQFETQLLDRGIAKVVFTGLPDREIAIEVPSEQIASLRQSLPDLAQRILGQSQDIPAGTVGEEESAREIRSLEKRRTAEGFADLPIVTTDGRRLKLGDIAEITSRTKENGVEIFYKQQAAVLMQLQRTESADTLKSAEIMNQWLRETRPKLPPTLQLVAFDEQYHLIEDRIQLLLSNGLSGLLLVVAILFIFLNGRVAFWVAVGIPISFMGTLAVLWLTGGSINMISLFALIMALGIIVDDAIVVAEDAMTHYERGDNSLQSAEGGAKRMLTPVIASSLTTVAAFLPLMLVSGIIGNILQDIPFVVTCVIAASLIESFFILPDHLRRSFRKMDRHQTSPIRQKLDAGFARFRDHFFRPIVVWTLTHRGTMLIGTFCLIAFSISLVATGFVRFTFFPTPEVTRIVAGVKFAAGTPPSVVKDYGHKMEQALWQVNDSLKADQDLVEVALLHLNQASFNGGPTLEQGDQYAMVDVELAQPDERDVRNPQFIEAWRKQLPKLSGIEQLSITSPQGGPPGKALDIFLSGADANTLKQAAEALKARLAEFSGVRDILDDLPWGKQQYIFKLTPLAESLGLTIDNVGRQTRAALDGQLLQVFYDAHDEIEVRIMLPKAERNLQRTLDDLPIITPAGSSTPLSNVIQLESRRGLELLRHTDGKLGVHVTADVDQSITNANQVLASIQSEVMPDLLGRFGLQVQYKGKAEEQRDTGNDMKFGAMIGFAMIYIILAWVFAAYSWPLAVMVAIPMGLCGAILGHWLLGLDLTILSQFGMFGLSGIVINDSIVLISAYKALRAEGMAVREALIEASTSRLRAVLLTSLTTIGGLTPLLFETSLQAQFLIPMAVSIAFGLGVGTLLILLVVPVLLSYIEDSAIWLQKGKPLAHPTQPNRGTGEKTDGVADA